MPIKVETKGPIFARQTSSVIARAFRETADRHAPGMVRLLKADAPKDTGGFQGSIAYRLQGSGLNASLVLFSDSPNAVYIEKGRKPGKMPPLMPGEGVVTRGPRKGQQRLQSILTPWVIRHGLGYGLRAAGIAYAIGRKQAKQGRPGLFIFRDFSERHAPEVQALFRDFTDRIVRLFNE